MDFEVLEVEEWGAAEGSAEVEEEPLVLGGAIRFVRERPVYEASLVKRVRVSSSVSERIVED